ncbi:F-box only protein 22-like [Centruroides sculpturatus]|uniref:F-box only protein 22-like n=1 Tax=Centruroides sculpturatus TaxID=218467 RepID=UPI000C6D4C8D|nr:F-box only protein 22-like [Centruroides sculpturatus]
MSRITDEGIGIVLSSMPPIVENILKNFCIKDLKRCGNVCKLWHNVSKVIAKQRHDIFRIFKIYEGRRCCVSSHSVHNSEQSCYAQNKVDIGVHFYDVLKTARSEPELVILFGSNKIFKKPENYFSNFTSYTNSEPICRKRKRKSKSAEESYIVSDRNHYNDSLTDFLESNLPRSCRIVSCAGLGIVGTPIYNVTPIEAEFAPGLSALFLPMLPGIEIYQFSISKSHEKALRKNDNVNSFVYELMGIPKDKHLGCLLIFFQHNPDNLLTAKTIIEHYLTKQDNQLAIGGAVVDKIAAPTKNGEEAYKLFTGLAFAGDNIQTASIILDKDINTEEKVLAKLTKLKNCNIPENNCIAFMFACCGRGCGLYNKSNVEAEAFHKIFPNVPLFGLFGRGEIGNEYLPQNGKKVHSNFDKDDNWYHGYTTIFVLISLQTLVS